MEKSEDYNKIMSDRNLFNKTVYTPLSEALKTLEERQKDKKLRAKIEKLLNGDIPEPLKKIERYGISGEQVATPNNNTKRFINLTKEFDLKPFFYEYHDDKFTSNNEFKHSLGQLRIHDHLNKKGDNIEEKITIIDFNKSNGKKLKDIVTLWSEPLIDFHKNLFQSYGFDKKNFIFYNGSDWLKRNGGNAENYYKKDLLLYICHGILFENFSLKGNEGNFTKKVLLPALEEVINLTGLKPLIVPILSIDTEEDPHWLSYEKKIKKHIKAN